MMKLCCNSKVRKKEKICYIVLISNNNVVLLFIWNVKRNESIGSVQGHFTKCMIGIENLGLWRLFIKLYGPAKSWVQKI